MKTDRILGFVFILVGGIIYSIERAVSIMSTSMIRAGFFAGSMTGEVPNVESERFFFESICSNFLVSRYGINHL